MSSVAAPVGAALVSLSGVRYQATGLSLLSSPHVAYSRRQHWPRHRWLRFGPGFGSGVGVDMPVGSPTVSEISNQYIVSAAIPLPPDYMANWASFHVECSLRRPAGDAAGPRAGVGANQLRQNGRRLHAIADRHEAAGNQMTGLSERADEYRACVDPHHRPELVWGFWCQVNFMEPVLFLLRAQSRP